MGQVLLISVKTIKEITQLHGNVDESLVQPEIQSAQDIFIEPLLGTALFNRLKAGIEASSLTDPEKTLLDSYIAKALAYYTLSELPEGLSIQFFTAGLVKLQSNNADGATLSEILGMAKRYKGKAEFYAERLVKYLVQNASATVFSEYLNPGTGQDVVQPGLDTYTCPFYFGED